MTTEIGGRTMTTEAEQDVVVQAEFARDKALGVYKQAKAACREAEVAYVEAQQAYFKVIGRHWRQG